MSIEDWSRSQDITNRAALFCRGCRQVRSASRTSKGARWHTAIQTGNDQYPNDVTARISGDDATYAPNVMFVKNNRFTDGIDLKMYGERIAK